MFFLAALLAAVGYSVQSTLMASFYRSMDRLSSIAYRGLSLGITMLPLLLFVREFDLSKGLAALPLILGAVLTAAVANWFCANAYSYLPVGIAAALTMSFTAVVAVVIGFFTLDESLEPMQLGFVGLVLVGVVLLGAMRSTGALPAEYNVTRGILHSLWFGILLGAAYVLVGRASQQLHPFLVGYLWEFTIGIVTAAAAWLRGRVGGASLSVLSWREFGRILLCSSPTAIGTGFYALATTMGPMAIAAAMLSTMMIFNTLLAMVLYRERLSFQQWCLLVFVCAMVIGLQVNS
jgi:drug/metabolite transporter (DMT)-like permease